MEASGEKADYLCLGHEKELVEVTSELRLKMSRSSKGEGGEEEVKIKET